MHYLESEGLGWSCSLNLELDSFINSLKIPRFDCKYFRINLIEWNFRIDPIHFIHCILSLDLKTNFISNVIGIIGWQKWLCQVDVKRITKRFTKTKKNDNESRNLRLNSREREREITVLQVVVDRCSFHGRLVQQKDTYNPDIFLLRIFQTGRCLRTLFLKSPCDLCIHWFVSGKILRSFHDAFAYNFYISQEKSNTALATSSPNESFFTAT